MKTLKQFLEDNDPCWKDYEMIGMKKKNGRQVPNCVPKEDAAANSVAGGGVDMNPTGGSFAFVKRDKRKKEDVEQMYRRNVGTRKIKRIE